MTEQGDSDESGERMDSVSILLAEPNLLLKEKMAGVLSRHEQVWCVLQVSRKSEIVRASARIQPDFVLADISMLLEPRDLEDVRRSARASRIFATMDTVQEPHERLAKRLGWDGVVEKSLVGERISREISAMGSTGDETDG